MAESHDIRLTAGGGPERARSTAHEAPAVELRLIRLPQAGSTNDVVRDLWNRAGGDLTAVPHLTTVVTDTQTAGRGRRGREWVAPAGKSLAISVLVRLAPESGVRDAIGWLPLLAGLALREAVVAVAPEAADRVTVKWPNDVLIDGRKAAGILGEVLGEREGELACVIGTGVNLSLTEDELPVPTATSLALAGIPDADADALVHAYVFGLARRLDELERAAGDAVASGAHAELDLVCSTLRVRVRASLPGGGAIVGQAVALAGSGYLVIEDDEGARHEVAAGDVERVRPEAAE